MHVDIFTRVARSSTPGAACGTFAADADGQAYVTAINTTDTEQTYGRAYYAGVYPHPVLDPSIVYVSQIVWEFGRSTGLQRSGPVKANQTYEVSTAIRPIPDPGLFNTDRSFGVVVYEANMNNVPTHCVAT